MRMTPDRIDALAAEYVLGTLRGRARARFEAHLREDPRVAAVVARWEAELTPLADRVPPVEPPARVWKRIESAIGATRPTGGGFWSSLGFWRSFGLLAGGVASVLVAAFLWISQGPRGEPLFIAVLTRDSGEPRMVVSMHQPDILRVRVVKPWKEAPDKSLELWVMPQDGGAPRSLGLVTSEGGDTIIHITTADPRVQGAAALAISREPAGGSPSRAPTGPVLCKGQIAPVRRT